MAQIAPSYAPLPQVLLWIAPYATTIELSRVCQALSHRAFLRKQGIIAHCNKFNYLEYQVIGSVNKYGSIA
jgi:hypothetical protein